MYDVRYSIELLRGMAAIISELFNQIFIPLTELISGQLAIESVLLLKCSIKSFRRESGSGFYCPCAVAENSMELVVLAFSMAWKH
jgi:hypothetical protein